MRSLGRTVKACHVFGGRVTPHAKLFDAVSKLALVAVRTLAESRICSAKFGLVPLGVFDKRAAAVPVLSGHGEKTENSLTKKYNSNRPMTLSLLTKAADLVLKEPCSFVHHH